MDSAVLFKYEIKFLNISVYLTAEVKHVPV